MIFIRLDRRHIGQLADIDFESEHHNDRARGVSRQSMEKSIIKRFNDGREIFFGYRDEGVLMGYVTLIPYFPGYKHCEVYWLAVRKKYQGRGIGSKLMGFIESYAKKKGFRKVFLYTGEEMERTRKFYEHRGYRTINEFPFYYGYEQGNTTAVLYGKKL